MDIPGYKLIFKCDRGAFGEVWLAEDAAGRRVALKIIEQPEFSRRELDGLRNYARIGEHPHLIRILHIEELSSCLYYTMEPADSLNPDAEEYLPATLSNILLRDGRMDVDRVRTLGAELLDGAAALHRAGLVHRDIKPENILYVNGTAKISDIGTLRPFAGSLTQCGTLGFIPPERLAAFSGCISAEDDLYALGKVLYCAWSGNVPEYFPSISAELLSEPGARQLNTVISSACAVDPKARFRTAAEFADALASGVPCRKRLRDFIRHQPGRLLAAALLIFVAGASAVLFLGDKFAPRAGIRISTEAGTKPLRANRTSVPVAAKPAATRRETPLPAPDAEKPTQKQQEVLSAERKGVPVEIVDSDGTPEGTRIHSFTLAEDSVDRAISQPLVYNGFNNSKVWRPDKLMVVERGQDFIKWHGGGSGWIWLPHEQIGFPLFRFTFTLDISSEHSDVDLVFHQVVYEIVLGRKSERKDYGLVAAFRFRCDRGHDGARQLSMWSRGEGRTRISKLVPNAGKNRIEIIRSRRDIQLFLNGNPAFDPIPVMTCMLDFGIGVRGEAEVRDFGLYGLSGIRRAE